jgi:hypothetical protein
MSLVVTTFFWKDPARARDYTFTHDHVRILRNMVARNLSLPHRFVCVTDDEIEGIETVKLDWSKHVPNTCFVRLCLRNPEFQKQLGERIFNLDLDVVIVGSLDPLVDRREDSVFWHNPNWPAPRRAFYQTSIQLLSAGSHAELWYDFDPRETPAWVNWRFGGAEQAWVSEKLPWDLPYWDHNSGIYGAGRIGDWNDAAQVELPANARIVSFPGNRIPDQPEVMAKYPWIEEHYR